MLFTLTSCNELFSNNSSSSNFFEDNLKTTDVKRIADVTIEANSVTCYVTPSGFDFDKLMNKGYTYMKITLSYSISYKRTFNGWDILYAGKPKYDITIEDESNMGLHLNGLETSTSKTNKSHSYNIELVDIKDNRIRLEIGSINIQNAIYFTNIKVDYKCY